MVSRVRHLEAGWSVRESVDTRSHKGRKCRHVFCRFRGFDQGGTWIVEESYDVTSGDIRWLLNFP